MKLVLILMVKNESKIIERCLSAVESVVDAFCVHDTGSTDTTRDVVQSFLATRKGCLTTSEWKNFGHNRTLSFRAARDFVQHELKWDLATTYGLLLDADMVFHAGTLRDQTLTETGYTILQCGGNLEYPNCRVIRMDRDWVCRGVTHEYWDGETKPLPRSVCWIDDKADGGCKSDKFVRDARLLEEGLQDEPSNVRYMFYLGQTYHCLGRHKDAIRLYKQRAKAGAWIEEQWYSLYMIGQSYLSLGDAPTFEKYMLKAYALRPSRAEPLYKLAKYFREQGQHYKAYQYIQLGKSIPMSTDSLFVEPNVYKELFPYEETICLYYLNQKREGLRSSMKYLLTHTTNWDNVYRNMAFYVQPFGTMFQNHPIPRDMLGRDFHPSSVSSVDGLQMVRFVNYSISNTGSYDMKEGAYSATHRVRTQNVLWNPTGSMTPMKDESVALPRRTTHILGLEDVRLYRDATQTLRFLATSSEYSEKLRIVAGRVDATVGTYCDATVIESPFNAACEKNWIPIPGTSDIVYSWNPLRVGHLDGSRFVIDKEIPTPSFFSHLRGSASPIRMGGELWVLVHYVEYSSPRKYFHCLVSLDETTYAPKAVSLPFVFRKEGIEYCLSMTQSKNDLEFVFSSWDDNPCLTRVPISSIEWTQV
jgi:glycosyltransferase involved in cell wall biosynthesis